MWSGCAASSLIQSQQQPCIGIGMAPGRAACSASHREQPAVLNRLSASICQQNLFTGRQSSFTSTQPLKFKFHKMNFRRWKSHLTLPQFQYSRTYSERNILCLRLSPACLKQQIATNASSMELQITVFKFTLCGEEPQFGAIPAARSFWSKTHEKEQQFFHLQITNYNASVSLFVWIKEADLLSWNLQGFVY